jgi:hypothetical protein
MIDGDGRNLTLNVVDEGVSHDSCIAVKNVWGARNIHSTKKGKSVSLRLDFKINVTLDSEDLNAATKGRGQNQRGAVHEFGHMLGLDDEYQSTSAHKADYPSILNRGETVNARHDDPPRTWVIKKLKALGVE